MKQAAASQEYSLLREETIAGETAMAWFLEAQGKKNRHWFSLRKGLFLHHGENYPLLSLREKLQKNTQLPISQCHTGNIRQFIGALLSMFSRNKIFSSNIWVKTIFLG